MGILPSFRLQGLPRHPCGRLWHGHVIMRRSTSPHLRRHSHGDWNLVVLFLHHSYHSCVPEGATAYVRVGVESKLSDPGRVGRRVWRCGLFLHCQAAFLATPQVQVEYTLHVLPPSCHAIGPYANPLPFLSSDWSKARGGGAGRGGTKPTNIRGGVLPGRTW